jgi:hypothetical protein
MSQVSVLNPTLNQGDLWGALWRAIGLAFGMFTVRGDPQSRFGVIGRPVFDPVIGAFLYLGVLLSLFRLFRDPKRENRVLHLSLLLWVPLLLVPSILGVKEVPHSLRAIGVMPVLFLLPAFGIDATVRALSARFAGLKWLGSSAVSVVVAGVLLVTGGISTGWDYFVVWGKQATPYYENDNDLADASRTLNDMALGDREIFCASIHYRHPTVAFLADSYHRIRWLVGGEVIAFPPADGPGAVYVLPRSAMPDQPLLDLLGAVADVERYPGPDGDTAYVIYELPPGHSPPITPQYGADANFGNQIELLGYDLPETVAGETLVATLYWRVLAPISAEDYLAFAHLRDPWDLQWGSSDVFDYPSSEWMPGQVIVQRRSVPISALTPPGDYQLIVGLASGAQNARLPRLDSAGRVAGTTVALGPVSIGRAHSLPAAPPSIQSPLQAEFGALRLLGFRRDQMSVRPGDLYYLGLFWQSQAPLPDLNVGLELVPAADGEPLSLWRERPVHGVFPTDDWPQGSMFLDQYGLTIPHDAQAGEYELVLSVIDRDSNQRVGEPVPLTPIQVEDVDRRMIVPPIQHPWRANLGDQVEFLGYDLDRTTVAPGKAIELVLYWRALARMDTSYTVFTHLLDGANQIQGQQDNPPLGGTYPTTLWVPGEVVVDPYIISVNGDAMTGTHAIEVGLYVAETGQRLPVLDTAGQVTGDRILVSEIEVR